MKFAIIIPDGCADEPQAALGGKTPLQAANTPAMDEIARLGAALAFKPCADPVFNRAGSVWVFSAIAATMAGMALAPAQQLPTFGMVVSSGISAARAPKTRLIAAASA